MCKTGDIIIVENYIHNGVDLSRHSFVVLNDEGGQIQGLDYDIVCNAMSSFKDEEQKKRKMKFPGNFPVTYEEENIKHGNKKPGYIKTDQLYYFNKDKTSYYVIGSLTEETFDKLIAFIESLSICFENIIDNLNKD